MRPIRLAILAFSLASLAQAAPEPATFCVLKITQGERETYKAMPSKEAAAERKRIGAEAKAALGAFNEKAAAFKKDRKNQGQPLPALEPEAPVVAVEKDALPSQEEADALAQDRQQKADDTYVVVRILGVDGKKSLEAVPQGLVRPREEALHAEYVEAMAKAANMDPQKAQMQAATASSAGAAGGTHFGSLMKDMGAPTKPVVTRLAKGLAGKDEAEKAMKGMKP